MDIFEIFFIPGKGISTKSIKDLVISAHFEVPANFEPKKFINKVIEFKVESAEDPKWWNFSLDASLSSEGNSYYYSSTHGNYCVKLDITLSDSLMLWYLISNRFRKSISLPTKKD